MILDIPRFKCFVKKKYLTNNKDHGFVEAYCFAVTLIESRPLLWTVHTVDGAVYSRLPSWAILHKKTDIPEPSELDIWGAISGSGGVILHQYLKDYTVFVGDKKGVYKFTIDYFSGGYAEDPEQHKCSHIVFLDCGHIGAYPNNKLKFIDRHFTEPSETIYRRNETYYRLD